VFVIGKGVVVFWRFR